MYTKTTIILDGGHGWETPGKRSFGIRENEFNDSIVSKLSYALEEKGFSVQILSKEWHDVPLKERIKRENAIVSNTNGPTILISIHADAYKDEKANGYTMFFYREGRALARAVHQAVKPENPLKDRGIKQENFFILKNSASPAILLECGFMTNKGDRAFLLSEKYRNRIVRNLVTGIMAYDARKIIAHFNNCSKEGDEMAMFRARRATPTMMSQVELRSGAPVLDVLGLGEVSFYDTEFYKVRVK